MCFFCSGIFKQGKLHPWEGSQSQAHASSDANSISSKTPSVTPDTMYKIQKVTTSLQNYS